MLDAQGHVVLTDFGLSKEFKREDEVISDFPFITHASTYRVQTFQLQRTNSYCGTIEYMAPEVIKRPDEGYTEVKKNRWLLL